MLHGPSDELAASAGGSARSPRLAGRPALVLAAIVRSLLRVVERAQRGAQHGELRSLGLSVELGSTRRQELLGALAIDQGRTER